MADSPEDDRPDAESEDTPPSGRIDSTVGDADENSRAPDVVILTGLSGSGKSTAANALEDSGFFCIDNLPVPLLGKVLELATSGGGEADSLGFVIDTRGRMFLEDAEEAIRNLRRCGADLDVVFLEATDESLVRRFSETRRRHPMSDGREEGETLREAIGRERKLLSELRELADDVVDTSDFTVHELKQLVQERYSGDETPGFNVSLISFGFKHGLPAECDLVFDVRFLDNPYFVESLRDRDGRDREVRDFVLGNSEATRFVSHFQEFAEFLLPRYESEGKTYLTIGIGCTGGHHRSVAVAEELADWLETCEWPVQTRHRDVDE